MINEIKMNELKDMFFYTFGIVPLQNYNVVGDGMTDNRLGIQQAIYDAIEVGAKYIFVPKGNYYYSGNLFKTEQVIFIGNTPDTEISGIEIRQFPDMWGIPVGAVIMYAGEKDLPIDYLECNGQAVNTVDYPNLYEALNDVTIDINDEDLPETFNIPNLTASSGMKYIIRAR